MENQKEFNLPRTKTSDIVYSLIIEWDGNRPPTRWYNRLQALGLFIRGSKEQTPLARRKSPTGVVHQEGALFLESLSQAKTLALLARDMGAVTVTIGETRILDMMMSMEDRAALARIRATLGRRGRPPKEDYFSTTCRDCLHTVESYGQEPPNCVLCGSFRISVRVGKRVRIKEITGDTLMRQWLNSRFVTGSWEEPELVQDGADTKQVEYNDLDVQVQTAIHNVLGVSRGGTTLLSQLSDALKNDRVDQKKALRYLDVAYRVVQLDIRERLDQRAHAIADWYRKGNTQEVSLFVDEENVDAFDLFFVEKDAPKTLVA